jgi:C1A family cysteine protease
MLSRLSKVFGASGRLRRRAGKLGFLLGLLGVSFAQAQENGLGCRPPTPAEQAWAAEHSIIINQVFLNRFGLERLNAERRGQGLRELREDEVSLAETDAEFAGQTLAGNTIIRAKVQAPAAPLRGGTSDDPMSALAPSGPLPASVDNSTLIWFPPIGNQGGLGSCASYSTTYYTMTYMVARALNRNVRGAQTTDKFSPKFIYNMINGGSDSGSWTQTAYGVMENHGAPVLSDWPYDGNYRAWPTTAALWRSGIAYRTANDGVVSNLDTPAGLANLKTMLANGYILNMALDIYGWQWTTIKDDPSTTADNALVGWPIVTMSKNDNSGHAMTIVGYDDNVWCDINNNGVVDPGEKGAFKVCNQWGTGWQRSGFAYVSYDALKAASSIPGADNTNREAAFWYQEATWMAARPSGYTPLLLGEFTLNTATRSQVVVNLGYGTTSSTTPSTNWYPTAIYYDGGAYAFDGGTTATDATAVFDFTDIADAGPMRRWFLAVRDTSSGGPVVVKNFKLTNGSGTVLSAYTGTNPSGGLPASADASTVYAWADWQFTDTTAPAAVTDLSAVQDTSTSAILSWTAPGDDGWSGNAKSYNLRYSTSPITSGNFTSATAISTSTPSAAGSQEAFSVYSLTAGTPYYFALKTTDEAGNVSALSNVASIGPATVTVAATDLTASEGDVTDTAQLVITRSGSNAASLSVNYAMSGAATNGGDYVTLTSPAVIPAGAASVTVTVTAIPNNVAQGDRTATMTLQLGSGYAVGSPAAASVTIKDKPMDAWRMSMFGAQANVASVAGDTANPTGDGIQNLMKYALGLDPMHVSVSGLPTQATVSGHLTLTYRRVKAAVDITCAAQVCGDLSTWTNSGVTEQILTDDGTYQTVTATDPQPATGQRFIRLKVTQP